MTTLFYNSLIKIVIQSNICIITWLNRILYFNDYGIINYLNETWTSENESNEQFEGVLGLYILEFSKPRNYIRLMWVITRIMCNATTNTKNSKRSCGYGILFKNRAKKNKYLF